MASKNDLNRLSLQMPGVTERGEGSYEFRRDGRMMFAPYPEKVHPKKAWVKRYDMFVMRIADADDKEACLQGEPETFFTTDHYDGYATVIVRLDNVDEVRLADLVEEAWEATPLPAKLTRPV